MADPTPTANRLAEIKARRAAVREHATDGDWHYDGSDAVHVFPADGGNAELVATIWGEDGSDDEEKAVGEFISHTPNDVDWLTAEVDRLNGVVQLLGTELQRDSMKVIDQLKQHEPCVPVEHVERFLKRERDNYEARTGPWRDVDDVLDAFRLHMVTGTPLTSPRPTEGPEALGAGPEPLTEAEELRVEVKRLREVEAEATDLEQMVAELTAKNMGLLAELAAIRARAHARSEELLTARDARPSDDRRRRYAFEFAANEIRAITQHIKDDSR